MLGPPSWRSSGVVSHFAGACAGFSMRLILSASPSSSVKPGVKEWSATVSPGGARRPGRAEFLGIALNFFMARDFRPIRFVWLRVFSILHSLSLILHGRELVYACDRPSQCAGGLVLPELVPTDQQPVDPFRRGLQGPGERRGRIGLATVKPLA